MDIRTCTYEEENDYEKTLEAKNGRLMREERKEMGGEREEGKEEGREGEREGG